MATVGIKDLEMEKELDDEAMSSVVGGTFNPKNLPEGSAYIGGGQRSRN
jgi:hypothetical protein